MAGRGGWDPLAVAAALAAVAVDVGYLWLIGQQGDRPVAWFAGGLLACAIAAAYGAARAAPWRRLALVASGSVLVVLGALALLTIGLPVVAAGLLALVAAARSGRRAHEPAA